jgi:protein tyrosine phosphatase
LPIKAEPSITVLQPIKQNVIPDQSIPSDHTSRLNTSVNCEQNSIQISSDISKTAQDWDEKRDEKPAINHVMIEKASTPSEPFKSFSSPLKPNDNSSKIDLFLQDYKKLERHVELLSQKTLTSTLTLLEKEWKDLNDYQEKQLEATKYTISVARLYPNKNRFHDLLPYDQNRVKLVKPNAAKSDDYINATDFGQLTTVPGSNSKQCSTPSFISTQMPTDFYEFWLMVLQERCELVVCLSKENEFEAGFYWPSDKSTPLNVSGIKICLQSVKETGYSIQRVLTASLDSTTRTVVLFQYLFNSARSVAGAAVGTGLGQNDMPENVGNFLKFVKDCESFYASEQRNKVNPVLTHCLNGVSRSAVFMLAFNAIQSIDSFYDEHSSFIETSSSLAVADLIVKLIKQMRGKRKYMIQTVSQLKYAYECVLFYMRDVLIRKNVIKEESGIDSSSNGVKLASNASLDMLKKSNAATTTSNVLTLQDVCDPNKFCLDLNTSSGEDGSSAKRKSRFTKDDFMQSKNSTTSLLSDPFSLIDSLKK